KRRVEVAGWRRPSAAAPASPGALRACGDPQWPRLAGARAREGFQIGRTNGIASDVPDGSGAAVGNLVCRFGRKAPHLAGERVWFHQNSDLAAAAAAFTSGLGTTKNSKLNNPVMPRTTLSSIRMGLKPGAGSSKYMTFTISR